MAEFALGLTKTVVAGAVSKVKSAIEKEGKLRVRVQDDLVFITGEFEMMQSFLNIASAERANNQVVQTWVRQLRGLAFDVEDCVELVIHLDKPSRLDWLRRLISSCMARPPLPLDVAVGEVQRLKARVEDITQRNTRYNLISNDSATQAPEQPDTTVDTNATSPFHILSQVWEAAGKKRDKMSELKRLICSEGDHLEVISLWSRSTSSSAGGADHLGIMPSIFREAYDDQAICNKFENRAWVKLMHPFNPEEFIKSVFTQFFESSHQANIRVNFRKKMKAVVAMEDELMQQVSQQRYLVFLEDLSTAAEWRAIRKYLPRGLNGSRIVMATQQLGLALYCTGEPYLVSELSDGLCVFYNKVPGRRNDMGDFLWQLTRRSTISVWGLNDGERSIVDKVYTSIVQKSTGFEGVEFERHNWVNVPDPFHLETFCWRLFLNFHSVNFQPDEIAAVGDMGYSGIIQACYNFLREVKCLVVINGLKSMDDWYSIKIGLLSEGIKGSIIVITYGEEVATFCADEEDGAFSVQDLEADVVLRHSIKGYQCYGTGGREEGRFLSNRRIKARDWTDRFGYAVHGIWMSDMLVRWLQVPGVMSLWGRPGAGKSGLVRRLYYQEMLDVELGFIEFAWVDVRHPFDLKGFSWDLFLDLHSDNPEEKETAVLSGIPGGQDVVADCRRRLCENKCFVVINGLQSKEDWDSIKDALISEPIKSCIVVMTSEKIVVPICKRFEEERLYNLKGLEPEDMKKKKKKREAEEWGASSLIEAYQDESDGEGSLRGRFFSYRMEEARAWMSEVDFNVHLEEWTSINECILTPGVISVWGIAGVGKSTLIKKIYYSRMLGLRHPGINEKHYYCQNQFTAFSWVHVPHPFDLKEFSWRLFLDFLSDSPEAKENAIFGMMAGHDPFEGCRRFLHQHECFVVIDALQSKCDWDLIKNAFLSKPIKGCIVVNTYEESVAAHCAYGATNVINVKGLEANVALPFFIKMAWRGKTLNPDEVEVSKLTLNKCGGLPKVIAAIGQYFGSGTVNRTWLEGINADFMGNLEKDPGFDNLRSLFSWMRSYFDSLSDSLKPCIFYLSVFPLDYKSIRPRRMVRRWIAEGYSRDKIGSTAEEDGVMLFSELVKLSIIQQSVSKVNRMCQVNGFFHEYIISRQMEDNLVFALEERCSPNSQRAGQHLTISRSWDRDEIVYGSIDFTRLRSLTVFGKWMSFFVSDNMRLLRVLDLEDTSDVTDDDLERIGKLLSRLKFLSLRRCTKITSLPDSLCDMRQLQTLDIKYTSVVTLPANITKLHKLQYVRAGCTMPSNGEVEDTPEAAAAPPEANGDCTVPTSEHDTSISDEDEDDGTAPSLAAAAAPPPDQDGAAPETWSSRARDIVYTWFSNVSKLRRRQLEIKNRGVEFVPAAAGGVRKLTALHTLGVVNVRGAGGKVVLRELKKLTQLRKLRLSGINRKNWQDLCCAISGHGYLESLSLQLDDKNEQQDLCCLDEITEPPKTLKSLKLYGGNVHVSLVWMKQLGNLSKASLEDLELTISAQEDMDITEELSFKDMYTRLCLKPTQDGWLRCGPREEHGVIITPLKARVLMIDCSTHKLAVLFGPFILEFVEVLVVHCSSTDSSLELFGIGQLSRLKEVWLTGSYSEVTKQHLEQKVTEHWGEPVLKLDGEPTRQYLNSICHNRYSSS